MLFQRGMKVPTLLAVSVYKSAFSLNFFCECIFPSLRLLRAVIKASPCGFGFVPPPQPVIVALLWTWLKSKAPVGTMMKPKAAPCFHHRALWQRGSEPQLCLHLRNTLYIKGDDPKTPDIHPQLRLRLMLLHLQKNVYT